MKEVVNLRKGIVERIMDEFLIEVMNRRKKIVDKIMRDFQIRRKMMKGSSRYGASWGGSWIRDRLRK